MRSPQTLNRVVLLEHAVDPDGGYSEVVLVVELNLERAICFLVDVKPHSALSLLFRNYLLIYF